MEMLRFFFDQFRVPIIGFLVLGTFAFVRFYLMPVRAEKVEETIINDANDISEKAKIAE